MSNKQTVIRNEYDSIIWMIKNSISSHPKASDQYEKWFLAGMQEAISEIKLAKKSLESIPEQSRYEVAMEVLKEFLEQDTRISEKQCARFEEWLEEKIPVYPEVMMKWETLERIKK